MKPLPANPLRSNIGTWAVPTCCLPAVGSVMHDLAPNESYDPRFIGQHLKTSYFDTPGFDLRKARVKGDHYLTLRLRCYEPADGSAEVYALSAKTEEEKWRAEIDPNSAEAILAGTYATWVEDLLPGNLLARLQDLVRDPTTLVVSACVGCRRYSVEDAVDRYTLDVDVHTDVGNDLSFSVLEHKSTNSAAETPQNLMRLMLRPIKLSKFKWATSH